VHYLPNNEQLALGDVLSSQVTVVSQQEFDQLCQLVPSQLEGVPQEAIINAACIAIPFLDNDLLISSIAIMENIGKHTDISMLPVATVPLEIWAALRAAIPSQGSQISSVVASSPAFLTAQVTVSGNSLPMDDSPTGTPLPPLFLKASTSQVTPLNNEANPIWVSSGDEAPHVNQQVLGNCMHSFSIDHTPGSFNLSPNHTTSPHANSRAVSTRTMIASQNGQDNFLDALMASDMLIANAETAVQKTLEELNIGVEGYSHYFLQEPLTLCDKPAIEVALPHLRHILDIAGTALRMGPHNELDSDTWRMLQPSDWFWASTYILSAVLRGCICTPGVVCMGNFPLLPLQDTFLYGNDLPELETQTDALKAMAMQIIENLQLNNSLILPQDGIDGICSTVWHAHKLTFEPLSNMEHCK
jgi:hypothetical protein